MIHIVIDLETLSLHPDAHILSIGAVALREDGQQIAEFYGPILPNQSQPGRRIDPDTIDWWMQVPEQAARDAIWRASPVQDAPTVLSRFTRWVNEIVGDGELSMWGNGPDNDNAWLSSLYATYGHQSMQPWKHWQNQSIRTLKLMAPDCAEVGEFVGVKHHALHDAEHEAKMVQKWLRQKHERKQFEIASTAQMIGNFGFTFEETVGTGPGTMLEEITPCEGDECHICGGSELLQRPYNASCGNCHGVTPPSRYCEPCEGTGTLQASCTSKTCDYCKGAGTK